MNAMPTVETYTYTGENNRVVKTDFLTLIGTYTGNFRDSIDLHNPVFTVEATVSPEVNYCKITVDSVTYCYFCSVENVRTGLSVLHCSRDVLTVPGLLDVNIVPARSASRYNAWLIDTRRPVETTVQHYNLLFNGSGFDYSNMSLIAGIVGTGGEPTNT